MKKLNNYIVLLLCLAFATSCEIDNYEGPDATIQGTIFEDQTHQPLQVDHGSSIIRMREISWAKNDSAYVGNQILKVQQDGTYRNTKWFSGEYRMLPYNGAFYPYDDINKDSDAAGELVKISGTVTKDFTITPYLIIDWVEEPTILPDNRIRCSVRFKRIQKPGYEMPDVKEAWLLVSRIINTSARDLDMYPRKLDLSNDMENQVIEFVSDRAVKYTGIDYYIRISMNCQTAAGKPETNYPGMGANNFTTIKKIFVP
ncbi:MAG: DUF3823 domain-containing protein [Tannerella sp.]|jgi:hypothetical protein|nr:DUF3823 domain-containing protein [Tannerella sp.]